MNKFTDIFHCVTSFIVVNSPRSLCASGLLKFILNFNGNFKIKSFLKNVCFSLPNSCIFGLLKYSPNCRLTTFSDFQSRCLI